MAGSGVAASEAAARSGGGKFRLNGGGTMKLGGGTRSVGHGDLTEGLKRRRSGSRRLGDGEGRRGDLGGGAARSSSSPSPTFGFSCFSSVLRARWASECGWPRRSEGKWRAATHGYSLSGFIAGRRRGGAGEVAIAPVRHRRSPGAEATAVWRGSVAPGGDVVNTGGGRRLRAFQRRLGVPTSRGGLR